MFSMRWFRKLVMVGCCNPSLDVPYNIECHFMLMMWCCSYDRVPSDLHLITKILRVFGMVSGLKTNT